MDKKTLAKTFKPKPYVDEPMRQPEKKCCNKPDVKNEGYVDTHKGRVWEFHCYHCDKDWSEIDSKKASMNKKDKIVFRELHRLAKKITSKLRLDNYVNLLMDDLQKTFVKGVVGKYPKKVDEKSLDYKLENGDTVQVDIIIDESEQRLKIKNLTDGGGTNIDFSVDFDLKSDVWTLKIFIEQYIKNVLATGKSVNKKACDELKDVALCLNDGQAEGKTDLFGETLLKTNQNIIENEAEGNSFDDEMDELDLESREIDVERQKVELDITKVQLEREMMELQKEWQDVCNRGNACGCDSAVAGKTAGFMTPDLNFDSADEFTGYLKETLIPDLIDSGKVETAKDFKKMVKLIDDGKKDASFAGWLKGTLIPDLREDGYDATATDFEEAIYWMNEQYTEKKLKKKGGKVRIKLAGGWREYSKELADVLETVVMRNKGKSLKEIFKLIDKDDKLSTMRYEEGMIDEDLMDFLEQTIRVYNR